MMRCTEEEYENTSALTIDWDLELARVDDRVQKALIEAEQKRRR